MDGWKEGNKRGRKGRRKIRGCITGSLIEQAADTATVLVCN